MNNSLYRSRNTWRDICTNMQLVSGLRARWAEGTRCSSRIEDHLAPCILGEEDSAWKRYVVPHERPIAEISKGVTFSSGTYRWVVLQWSSRVQRFSGAPSPFCLYLHFLAKTLWEFKWVRYILLSFAVYHRPRLIDQLRNLLQQLTIN